MDLAIHITINQLNILFYTFDKLQVAKVCGVAEIEGQKNRFHFINNRRYVVVVIFQKNKG